MYFHSFTYLFAFLPLTWLIYMVLRRTALRPVVLIVSGYLFYAWGTPWIAILLFLSSNVDFFIGLLMDRTEGPGRRKILLILSLVFNLGLLAVFKYSGWAFDGINALMAGLHISHRLPQVDVTLPPGISFYTFQSLSYIIDIYRRKMRAHHDILNYYAFVAFFPQLFAGPIERAGHLLPQIVHPAKRIHPRMIEMGIFMIVLGLFKKLVVAENMAGMVDLARDNITVPGARITILLAFTFQIYADFSAYTDIARGSAKLFGFRVKRNFLTPYLSASPSEFWTRWHISLSSWIRDYLYVPLGGNRKGKLRTLFNLLLTMLLAGLWHGASKYFLFWGLYHGLLLVLYRFFPIDKFLIKRFGKLGKAVAIAIMFALIVLGWGLFYAGSHGSISKIFFPPADAATVATVSWRTLFYGLALFAAPVFLTDLLAWRKHREFADLWPHFSLVIRVMVILLLFYGIVFFGARDSHEFIYFQF